MESWLGWQQLQVVAAAQSLFSVFELQYNPSDVVVCFGQVLVDK